MWQENERGIRRSRLIDIAAQRQKEKDIQDDDIEIVIKYDKCDTLEMWLTENLLHSQIDDIVLHKPQICRYIRRPILHLLYDTHKRYIEDFFDRIAKIRGSSYYHLLENETHMRLTQIHPHVKIETVTIFVIHCLCTKILHDRVLASIKSEKGEMFNMEDVR